MKFNSIVAVLAVAGLLATSYVGAEEADKEAKAKKAEAKLKEILKTTTCPITGKEVNPEKVVAYKDSKVYVCCGNCLKNFETAAKKKPEILTKANHQLVMTKQAKQVKCCVNGKGKINKEAKTKVVGVQVNTCCKNCLGKLTKMEADEQIALAFGKNFDKAFVVKAQEKKKKEKEEKEKDAA